MKHLLLPSWRAAAALAVLALAGDAVADGYGYGGPAPSADAWPTQLAQRPRTLARGMLEIAAPVGVDVSVGAAGTPATVPLTLHAGLTDWLTLGLGHVRGLCLGDAAGGCASAYDDFRVDALARFYAAGPFSAAYGVAVAASSVHGAVALSADALFELRLAWDRFALALSPDYGFGLDRRATGSRISAATFPLTSSLAFGAFAAVPNRETVHAPLAAELQLSSRLAVAAAIALDGVVDPVAGSFSDGYRVPVGFAAVITPARMVDVGAALTFPNLAGRSDGLRPRSDERVVQAFIALRTGGGGASPAPAIAPAAMPAAHVAAAAPAPAPVPAVAHGAAAAEVLPGATGAGEVTPAVAAAPPAAFTLVIERFAFAPLTLEVPPGATVAVRNLDGAPHSVTSERAPGDYTPGAVSGVAFDTGAFTGESSFTVPADAPPGTVVPFYCSVHGARMSTPNGELRVVAPR